MSLKGLTTIKNSSDIYRLFLLFWIMTLSVYYMYPVYSQELQNPDPVVYAIKVEGNRVTSNKLILREMMLHPGIVATPELIKRDQLRLESLGLFNRVVITLVEDEGRAVVLVTVAEPFYIYLFPRLRYNISKPDRYVWGGGIYHHNFRGFGEQITAIGWTGYNHGMYLSYRDPFFTIGGHTSFSSYGIYMDTELEDPSCDYFRTQQFVLGVVVRRRITELSWCGIGFDWEDQSSPEEFYTYSASSHDRLMVGKLLYEMDRRDYRYYPHHGYLTRITLETNHIVKTNHFFYRQRIDLRKYIPIGKVILAGRLLGVSSQHRLPYYRRLSLNYKYIRASHDFGSGGWFTLAGNIEVRFNILKKRYFSLDMIPLAGQYLREMQFSIEAVTFYDTGYVCYSKDNHVVKTELLAWGSGLQFQLPYIETAHFLVGWGPKAKLKNVLFITGVGVTF